MFYSISFLLHFYFFLIFSSSLTYKCAAQLDMLSQQIILYQNSLFFSLSKYCSISLCFIFPFNLCSSIYLCCRFPFIFFSQLGNQAQLNIL
ncbi:expressed protein [Phakopsora pachyrhizi]|uniref:Expressed protein n=1 Tax=Phakopsora pachyrhizi TaxID=170000 RepID=A0AAV0BHC6_PHAPC|nr:expressed protein [Phakopsora pachyrhizi]